MKVFLSGAECGSEKQGFEQMVKHGSKYYLFSYYNLRNKNIEMFLKADGEIFIDSGAHTLQKPGKEVDWDKFVNDYIAFVNKWKKYIDYIVELDVENKIGLKKVEEYRDKIWKETGIEPIVVWHKERGFDYLKYMCKTYKYIGFSGFVEDNTGQKEVPDKFIDVFIKMAHDKGAKVHGFGYTTSDLYKHDFDSVDSSSWSYCKRFGVLNEFKLNRIIKKIRLTNYKAKYYDIIDNNVIEWIKYQRFLDKI